MSLSSLRPFLRFFTPTYFNRNTLFLSPCLNEMVRDEKRKMFLYKFNNDGVAYISYKDINGIYELEHTFIPEKFKGRRLGVPLARSVMDYCLRNDIRVKLTCPYLQRFYAVNFQRYRSIVV